MPLTPPSPLGVKGRRRLFGTLGKRIRVGSLEEMAERTSPGSGGPKKVTRSPSMLKTFFAKDEIEQAAKAQVEAAEAKEEHEKTVAELAKVKGEYEAVLQVLSLCE